jgi:hypothetical protein
MRAFFAMEKRGELPKGTAQRWAEETSDIKRLPEKAGGKMAGKSAKKTLAETAAKAYENVKEKTPPGEGGRFKALTKAIAARGGVENPAAVAAVAGRKKYGKAGMAKMAAKGRRKR